MNRKSLPAPPRQDDDPAAPRPRVSDRLTQAIDHAAAGPRDSSGRLVRSDGWTPQRIRIFLDALADCGTVREAARAAGMAKSSAYAFRRRAEGRGFAMAWDAAVQLARPYLADELMSRAIHGCVEIIMRDGEVWGERHRFDNRQATTMLTRMDQKMLAGDAENTNNRYIAGAFDEFVDIVCAGGEGIDDFLLARAEAEREARSDGMPTHIQVSFVRPEPAE